MTDLYTKDWRISNIKAVLFDKDGTFLDDNIYWGKLAENRIRAIIKYFNLNENDFEPLCFAIGYNPITCNLIKNGPVGVMSRDEVVDFMVKELEKYDIYTDFKTLSQIFDDVHKEFLNNIEKYVKFIDYSEDLIRNLKNKGLKLAVVTSDTVEHTSKILKILNIAEMFDCIIGKDSCTEPKKTGKPALLALKKLNVNAQETIVIGDALMDYLMAKNSKLKKEILVATGQTEIEELKKYSQFVINNLSEVLIK